MGLVPRQDGDVLVWNAADETYYHMPLLQVGPCNEYYLYDAWDFTGDDPAWDSGDGTYTITLDRLEGSIPPITDELYPPVTLFLARYFDTSYYADLSPVPTVQPSIDGVPLERWTHPFPTYSGAWEQWSYTWTVPYSIYSSWTPGQTITLFLDKDNAYVMDGVLSINCVGSQT